MRFVLAVMLALPVMQFAREKPEQPAQQAAEKWLALVDAGKYGESWEQAAKFFKSKIMKDAWTQQVSAVRDSTGKLESRRLQSAQYTENLPNAPSGKYVILRYQSSFGTGPFIETVVPMQEKDGSWKVAGYFVKPAEQKSQ